MNRHFQSFQIIRKAITTVTCLTLLTTGSPFTSAQDVSVQGEGESDPNPEVSVPSSDEHVEGVIVESRPSMLSAYLLFGVTIVAIFMLAGIALYWRLVGPRDLRRFSKRMRGEQNLMLGQVAAGLAHEIRNPLHAIGLNLRVLGAAYAEQRLDNEEVQSIVAESQREIQRVDGLITQLLGYAKPELSAETTCSLNTEIENLLLFMQAEFRQNDVEIVSDLSKFPCVVSMSADRVRQVVINLLMNATEAMTGPGQIYVSLRKKSSSAELKIADTGRGVLTEDRERIFHPFVSTKEESAGLGLPLVKRLVDDADGTIEVLPNRPKGTIFKIRLPLGQKSTKTKMAGSNYERAR